MRRFVSLGAGALVLGLLATPIASAQQSVNFYVGAFTLRGQDARDKNDVLLNNLNFLAFNIKDFNGPTFGGEWLIGFGNNFEGSLGVGFSTRTVPTVYLNFVNTNGAEIEQDLKLRVVPFTATVRFLPLGRGNGIEPYIGAATGPVILGGVRVPVGSWAIGGEIRYQSAKGDLPADQDFSGNKLDLGGFNYLFTVNVRF
jgi:hypothetical protein